MTNRHLALMIVALLALLAFGVRAFLDEGAAPRPRAADFADPGEEPPVKLHALLTRRKPTGEPDAPRVRPSGPGGAAGVLDLSKRGTGEAKFLSKLNIPASKRKNTVGQWADTPAYRSLFTAPEPPLRPSYAETLEKKADEVARAAGFNRAFGVTVESALKSPALRDAEKLFNAGSLDDALARFTDLLKSENLYLKSVAAAYILRIHDLRGDKERTDAARANLAVLSAKVAKEAFPDAVAKMGAESPAVKRAMEALSGGELMKLTLPSDAPAPGAPQESEATQ